MNDYPRTTQSKETTSHIRSLNIVKDHSGVWGLFWWLWSSNKCRRRPSRRTPLRWTKKDQKRVSLGWKRSEVLRRCAQAPARPFVPWTKEVEETEKRKRLFSGRGLVRVRQDRTGSRGLVDSRVTPSRTSTYWLTFIITRSDRHLLFLKGLWERSIRR